MSREGAVSAQTPRAAVAEDLLRYDTGRPCKRGHVAERWVSSRRCVACDSEWRAAHWREIRERDQRYYWERGGDRKRMHRYHQAVLPGLLQQYEKLKTTKEGVLREAAEELGVPYEALATLFKDNSVATASGRATEAVA